jgi:hypothetical protein
MTHAGLGRSGHHPLDLHFEDIARLHENQWFVGSPDATECAGDDHIIRLSAREALYAGVL